MFFRSPRLRNLRNPMMVASAEAPPINWLFTEILLILENPPPHQFTAGPPISLSPGVLLLSSPLLLCPLLLLTSMLREPLLWFLLSNFAPANDCFSLPSQMLPTPPPQCWSAACSPASLLLSAAWTSITCLFWASCAALCHANEDHIPSISGGIKKWSRLG